MGNTAVSIKNLTKTFYIPHERRDNLKEHFTRLFRPVQYETMRAVDDMSFEVRQGEFLGIIGPNGAGKSTLLKMIAGVFVHDEGTIEVRGRIAPFLELGVGMQLELSGKDNVYVYGALLGLPRKELDERYADIVSFSGLERFMDQAVKNYSTGMQVRLAFSINVHVDADILLVDEVLAVGDQRFQQKCLATMREFHRQGKTIIFVSHSLKTVEEECSRVIWFDQGCIHAEGRGTHVIQEYARQYT